jgi:two-component system response regulator YesN
MDKQLIYKVLLVDDELIILSGLKFLINWKSIGCEIIDTASNGQEALKIIEEKSPDIVICDINLPVFDGIEVLRQCNNLGKNTVFIMLTNHQDFHLAQQALKYKAVDYIIKTNLQPELLIQSIENAQNEINKKRKIKKIDFVESYIYKNETDIIKSSLLNIINSASNNDHQLDEQFKICNSANIFRSYCIIQIYINNPDIVNINLFTAKEKNKLMDCEKDIINKICKNFFEDYIILDYNSSSVLVFVSNYPNIDKQYIRHLYRKILTTSKNILEISVDIAITDVFNDSSDIYLCIEQLKHMNNFYYYNNKGIIFYDEINHNQYKDHFDISTIINDLSKALTSYNFEDINSVFEKLIELLITSKPEKQNAINCCIRIYNYTIATLQSLDNPKAFNDNFSNSSNTINKLISVGTFEDVISWIRQLNSTINNYNISVTSKSNNLIDSAKEFILEHIDTKLTLNSVANYLSITPSYLSHLFKKECNRNFVDYINQLKIDKACKLLNENQYLIYEIAYMLGFDNAYYFTKIFKKYKGVTPKEYLHKISKDIND